MARNTIGVIVGSARKGSINQKLANALMKLGGPDVTFRQLRIDDLPMFNQDIEDPAPPSVERFRNEIRDVDGLLFVTPEYNRSITPLLLNALSWGSRPYGHNSFRAKPAAMAGTSAGAIGTAAAQAHLRNIFGVLDIRLIGQPEAYVRFSDGLISEDGTIADEEQKKALRKKIGQFVEWVNLVANAEKQKKAA